MQSHENVSDCGADCLINKLQNAFEHASCQDWLDCFDYEDDMSYTAEKDWFVCFIMNESRTGSKIDWLNIEEESDSCRIICRLAFQYGGYSEHTEQHTYTAVRREPGRELKIVLLEKERYGYPAGAEHRPYQFQLLDLVEDPECFVQNEKEESENRKRHPLPASLYARAVPRSIRYRQAHPAIECASVRLGMLSLYTIKAVCELYEDSPSSTCVKLYNSFKDFFKLSIQRPDRDNTWSSKFKALWKGFDELIMTEMHHGRLICSCSSYMTFLHSAFRLAGLSCDDILQIRMKTQDILVVFLEGEPFLIDTERMVKVTGQTVFHQFEVSVIYTDEWFWTAEGETNMPLERRDLLKKRLSRVHFLHFDFKVKRVDVPEPGCSLDMKCFLMDYQQYRFEILQKILTAGKREWDSVDAWSLYAYQDLSVWQPQAYLLWSIQSQTVRNKAFMMKDEKDIISYVRDICTGSIFIEIRRIMTADQVIGAGRGDAKAKSLLMAVLMQLVCGFQSAVLLTSKTAYCVWLNQKYICFETGQGFYTDWITGRPLILISKDRTIKYMHCPEEGYPLSELHCVLQEMLGGLR